VSGALRLAQEAKGILEAADKSGRALTSDERIYVEQLLDRAKEQGAVERQLKDIGEQLGNPGPVFKDAGGPFNAAGSPGEAFVQSEGYKSIRDSRNRGDNWTTGPVDVGLHMKGTLGETTGGAGPGGGLTPPGYVPGVVSTLFQPLGLADYFPQQQTSASQVRYVVEGTATSTAAGVAEGAPKPEATLGYTEVSEKVVKIAQVVPVSDELLEDATAIQTYVNGRLSLFVRIAEETQLLRGAGGNDLNGIFNRGISTTNAGTTNADRIFRAAAGVRGSAFMDPDLVVMHPTNWTTSRLQQDTAGQYMGGGPWGGQYGSGTNAQASSFSSSPYWGMQVWVTPVVGAGTALVASTQAATIYRRGGLNVSASDSHNDFFVRNLHMLRAEERLALACFRPSAFCAVTGLT
jgi:HK97 family phage major capsid protein